MVHHRRISPSITARLILGLTLATTALWCGAAAAYSTYVSFHELNEAFDRALQEAGRRLLPLAAEDVLGHEDDDAGAIHHFIEGRGEYLSYQLRNSAGRVVLRAHDAPTAPYDERATPGLSTVGNYRLFTDTDETTGLTITMAETTRGRPGSNFRRGAWNASAARWPYTAEYSCNLACRSRRYETGVAP